MPEEPNWRLVVAACTGAFTGRLVKVKRPKDEYVRTADGAMQAAPDASKLRFYARTPGTDQLPRPTRQECNGTPGKTHHLGAEYSQ